MKYKLSRFILCAVIVLVFLSLTASFAVANGNTSFRYLNIDGNGHKGISSAATWMSFREIEVYDANGNKYTPVGATVSNDWVNTQWGGYGKASAYDGNIYTAWNNGTYGGWYTLDLGSVKSVSKIRLLPAVSPNPAFTFYDVKISSDGQSYTPLNTFSPMIEDNVWLECTFSGTTPVCNGNSTGGGSGDGGDTGGGGGAGGGGTIPPTNPPVTSPKPDLSLPSVVSSSSNALACALKAGCVVTLDCWLHDTCGVKNSANPDTSNTLDPGCTSAGPYNIITGKLCGTGGGGGGSGGTTDPGCTSAGPYSTTTGKLCGTGGGGGSGNSSYVWSADQCTEAMAQGAWSSGIYSETQVRTMAGGGVIDNGLGIYISLNRDKWEGTINECVNYQLNDRVDSSGKPITTLAGFMAAYPLNTTVASCSLIPAGYGLRAGASTYFTAACRNIPAGTFDHNISVTSSNPSIVSVTSVDKNTGLIGYSAISAGNATLTIHPTYLTASDTSKDKTFAVQVFSN